MTLTASAIDLLQARDPATVTAAVHEHSRTLYRAALGLGFVGDQASELVQVVWKTFFEKLPDFRGDSTVRTFLFGILYRKALEYRRELRRYDLHEDSTDYLENHFSEAGCWVNHPVSPERFVLGAEMVETIQDCLDDLTSTQRMAFLLRTVEEQDTEEVCKILNVSTTNLGVLISRARVKLRECIELKGVK